MCTVYKLVDPTGRVRYVGITDNVSKRKRSHARLKKAHEFVIVSVHDSREAAGAEEIRLIEEYGTHVSKGGWNRTFGGEDCNIKGLSRKGIGGRKKGSAGKSWTPSYETRSLWSKQRSGKVSSTKFDESVVAELIRLYKSKPNLPGIGENGPNGKILTYETAFAKAYAPVYDMTPGNLKKIITGKTVAWKHLL